LRSVHVGDTDHGVHFFKRDGLVPFMRNFDEEKAGSHKWRRARDLLAIESGRGQQAPVVIELRGHRANHGMQPVRAIEEEALVVAERLALLADQVDERRDVRAFRVGAALGLLELLRIAEEDDVARDICPASSMKR
jgi:hypothetical protein